MQPADLSGPSWQGLAVAAGSLLQLAVLAWMKASADDRANLRTRLTESEGHIVALNTLIGVNGNGIIGRLDAMNIKLDKVLNEQAELRGAHNQQRRSDD